MTPLQARLIAAIQDQGDDFSKDIVAALLTPENLIQMLREWGKTHPKKVQTFLEGVEALRFLTPWIQANSSHHPYPTFYRSEILSPGNERIGLTKKPLCFRVHINKEGKVSILLNVAHGWLPTNIKVSEELRKHMEETPEGNHMDHDPIVLARAIVDHMLTQVGWTLLP